LEICLKEISQMTPEEKILYYIREDLIEIHGIAFLQLSERDQNLIICDVLQELFKR
jgi:hypothetical protein